MCVTLVPYLPRNRNRISPDRSGRLKPMGSDLHAERAKANGQYTGRQTDQDGFAAAAGRRPSGALPLGPVYSGDPEALRQGAAQVLWSEIPEPAELDLEDP